MYEHFLGGFVGTFEGKRISIHSEHLVILDKPTSSKQGKGKKTHSYLRSPVMWRITCRRRASVALNAAAQMDKILQGCLQFGLSLICEYLNTNIKWILPFTKTKRLLFFF